MLRFQDFVDDYYQRFSEAIRRFDKTPLRDILDVIDKVIENQAVLWVAGNGGSAAISNHMVCDMSKGTYQRGKPPLRCHSLSANVPIMTALGNDVSYDDIYRAQLEYYLKPSDAVLLVSSSGNSQNVIKACDFANEQGNATIAFVGFDGGKLREIAQHCVWVPVENYGIVEDTHQSLMHVLSQYLLLRSTSQ